jgi:uncharacterized protein with GYD domain
MLFLQISRHMPESCPLHNEKTKKTMMDLMAKMEKLAKKYGVKMVGNWVAIPEHLIVSVYDAPSMETLLKLSMEPEVMAWMGYNITETMPVMTLDEVQKILK